MYAYQRVLEAPEPWSLYNYPSDTYGVGGLCGGTQAYGSEESKEEMKRIRGQVDADMRIFLLQQKEQEKEKK